MTIEIEEKVTIGIDDFVEIEFRKYDRSTREWESRPRIGQVVKIEKDCLWVKWADGHKKKVKPEEILHKIVQGVREPVTARITVDIEYEGDSDAVAAGVEELMTGLTFGNENKVEVKKVELEAPDEVQKKLAEQRARAEEKGRTQSALDSFEEASGPPSGRRRRRGKGD